MNSFRADIRVGALIMVPALIALGITLLRLVGELWGGSSFLFNREAGGGGALVGIVWLVPIFGVYFAFKLVRAGQAPQSAGRVIGFAFLGLFAGAALMGGVTFLTGDPSNSAVALSFTETVLQQLGYGVAAVVAVSILAPVWPPFFRTLLGYAFASRLPVLMIMFLAMLGNWGTHYELGPLGYMEMAFLPKFILIAVMPQMTFWIMFTMLVGTLCGGIAAAVVRPRASG